MGGFQFPTYDPWSGSIPSVDPWVFGYREGSRTQPTGGEDDQSWWQTILGAGVSIVGDIFGRPRVTVPTQPGTVQQYPQPRPYLERPDEGNTGLLIGGAILAIYLLSKKR